jgi:diguanylate cyclase (GGDEF)-like protein
MRLAPSPRPRSAGHLLGPDEFSRKIALAGYWTCLLITVALVPFAKPTNWAEVLSALGFQALLGSMLAVEPQIWTRRHRGVTTAGVVLYLVSVALLRDGAGPLGGFGPLVLLPVGWAALRGWRREFGVAVVGLAAVYLVPAFVIGGTRYPDGTWRAGILFVVIACAIGVAILSLVRRIHRLLAQLDTQARTDELTGLPNRRALQDALEDRLRMARRGQHRFSVAIIDLDGFKRYNDTRGHLAGDRLLRESTAAWRSQMRETDVLARWGGDEFVALLQDADPGEAAAVVERFRSACPRASFSAGVAVGDARSSADAVIAAADAALYRVKQTRVLEQLTSS